MTAPSGEPGRARCVVMVVLAAAFLLRVAAQAAVVAGWAPWLPPPAEWQSGLLPYPALLASQIAIVCALGLVLRDVMRGGRWRSPGRVAPAVRRFAALYAGTMLVRYALTRLAHPEWGWLGHTIPVWLHLALAAWLWAWADDGGALAGRHPGLGEHDGRIDRRARAPGASDRPARPAPNPARGRDAVARPLRVRRNPGECRCSVASAGRSAPRCRVRSRGRRSCGRSATRLPGFRMTADVGETGAPGAPHTEPR